MPNTFISLHEPCTLLLLSRDVLEQTKDLGLVITSDCRRSVSAPLQFGRTCAVHLPALPWFQSTTSGLWNEFPSAFNRLSASVSSFAPSMTLPTALGPPRYSRMFFSWSPVGGSSVTSSSNSVR